MKNIQSKIIILLILTFSIAGCEEFLEVEPTTSVNADNAITNERGLQSALNGVYDAYQSAALAQDLIIFPDLAADNLINIGSKKEYRQISDNRIIPNNVYVEGYWNRLYDVINRINHILDKLPEVEGLTEAKREYYEGQAYFMRAFSYFNLVKFFDGVPLRKDPVTDVAPEILNVSRASTEETYNFIEQDLDTAEVLLADASFSSSFANYYAVRALQARIKLYREEWTSAYLISKDIIESGQYSLVPGPDYDTLFADMDNPEIIFQIDFSASDDVNALASWTQEAGRFEVAAWNSYDREVSIADEFQEDDYRKDVTVAEGLNHYYCNKYADLQNSSDNIIHFRLAEMFLIAAEALNEKGYVADGWAFDYLNAVHVRAGLDSLSSADLTNQSEFRDAIQKERRLELAFEGHRYFDLVRTDRAASVLGDIGTLADNNWLFPIPQSEIDANESIEQNGIY